jgi:hypothetical protein
MLLRSAPLSIATAGSGAATAREFFTHPRFHKHEEDGQIVVHMLVELYGRSPRSRAAGRRARRGALRTKERTLYPILPVTR